MTTTRHEDWQGCEVRWPIEPAAAVARFAAGDELAWLDSADAGGEGHGAAWSLICARPLAVLEQYDGSDAHLLIGGHAVATDRSLWDLWRRAVRRLSKPAAGRWGLVPGWVGYLGFELGRQLERLPASHRLDDGVPLGRMSLFDRGIVLDHAAHRAFALRAPGVSALAELRADAPGDRDWVERWEDAAGVGPLEEPDASVVGVAAEMSVAEYEIMLDRALAYIRDGDIYQVNLAQRLRLDGLCGPILTGGGRDARTPVSGRDARTPLSGRDASTPVSGRDARTPVSGRDARTPQRRLDGISSPFAAYAALRRANPAPYAALLAWEGGAVLSVSPELFLRVRGDQVLTRPIKGTRPRIGEPQADLDARRELLTSPKEAAELAMIVDLHRNDLGRVCRFGSVQVVAPRRLEVHPTVFHTVADVVGRLRAECDAIDLLTACFPAGSISGVPKIRAIEIIDELEPVARGAYTGAIGVLGLDGGAAFSVAIRTVQVNGSGATLHVGGGIVADSDPAAEYAETLAKARGILRGLGATASMSVVP